MAGMTTLTVKDGNETSRTVLAATDDTNYAVAHTVVDSYGNSIVDGTRISRMGERESMGVTATGEDIWRGNDLSPAPASHISIPTPSSSGEQMSVVSEDAADTIAGTGVQVVTIEYLDGSGNQQTTTVNMNGTTPVDLTPSDVRFVNDMYASQVGSNGVAEDHIKIHNTATVNLVYDMIAKGGNKSLVPHFMVPLGYALVMENWHSEEAQGKRVNARIRADCTPGGVRQAGVFLFKGTTYLNKSAPGDLPLGDVIPALSIIKVSGWPDAGGSGAECSVGWTGRLRAT